MQILTFGMPALSGEFSDFDLDKLIRQTKVEDFSNLYWIYIWSPHMNYSVRGLREAGRIAQMDTRVHLVPILDPNARTGGSEHEHPILASDRLIEEGALLHFPAVFLIRNGRLSKVRLGYDPPDRAREILQRSLK